jgi:hypothetical protein
VIILYVTVFSEQDMDIIAKFPGEESVPASMKKLFSLYAVYYISHHQQ